MRFTRTLTAALPVGATLVGLLLPGSALAQPYDNTDPATACSGSAYTLTSAPVDDKFTTAVVGTLELRWSRTCNTGWARFTPAPGYPPTTATLEVDRPSDSGHAAVASGRYFTDWPLYSPQLNGSSGCISVKAATNGDGGSGAIVGSGLIACAGGTPPVGSFAETTGGAAETWTDYTTAGGTKGPTIGATATVHVACRRHGFAVADGNTWWYRVASKPWSDSYYVSADAFYNNGATSGSLSGTPFVDTSVSLC